MSWTEQIQKLIAQFGIGAGLDALAEKLRLEREKLAECEEHLKPLDKAPDEALRREELRYRDRLRDARAKLRQAIKDIEFAIDELKRRREEARAEAAKEPISDGDRHLLACARTYVGACEAVELAADKLADALREALAAGEELGAHPILRGLALNYFKPGYWRERVTAGLMRKFEREPGAAGQFMAERATLLLSPNVRRLDISALGFAGYERKGVREALPLNIRGLL